MSTPQGRFVGAELIDGLVLHRIDAYGKHLFYRFGPRRVGRRAVPLTTVHVHLGLFGKFTRFVVPAPAPRGTVRLRMAGARVCVDLTGPTDCRIVDPDDEKTILGRLGPDPLRSDADPELAWKRLSTRRVSVGEALMDQKVMAGVGNVYRAESLFVHGIHPSRPCNEVSRVEFDGLWESIASMLRQGVKDGRIITLADDELPRARRRLRSKEAVYVYKRDRCLRCDDEIRRWDLAGRWAYACPTCQPA